MSLTSSNSDASGAEKKDVSHAAVPKPFELPANTPPQVDDTATAILKKKKKPNSLMYAPRAPAAGPGVD